MSAARTGRLKPAIAIALVLFGLYGSSIIVLRYFADYFIFHPDARLTVRPDDQGLAYTDVWLTASDGVKINAWLMPAVSSDGDRPAAHVLFLHGNAGNLSIFLDKMAPLVKRGLTLLAVDYRGYGASSGRPSEEGLYRDAAAGYRYLTETLKVPAEEIVIWGYSLGGAAATELALTADARALVLESTFTSIKDMASRVVPWAPSVFLPDMFDSINKVPRIQTPTLFIHGTSDEVVPVGLGKKLYAAHGGPKQLYLIEGAGHTDGDDVGGRAYFRRVLDFIQNPPTGREGQGS